MSQAETARQQTFGEIVAWQRMLERHSELFIEMQPGSRIGLVPRDASGIVPGRAQVSEAVPMMVWQAAGGGMSARIERFAGLSSPQVDLLLVADTVAIAAMLDALDGDLPAAMRRLIRQGRMVFFVFQTKSQLQDAGYADFLDTFGLPFLGACR